MMMKWKINQSRRKRKETMKMKKMMVWMEEIGINGGGVYLPIIGG